MKILTDDEIKAAGLDGGTPSPNPGVPTPEPGTPSPEPNPGVPTPTPAPEPEPAPEPQFNEQELESQVLSFMSERLGRQFNSFDDFIQEPQAPPMDQRLESIAQFVADTGRSVEDWFAYQSLNPSEMDDMTALRVSIAADYPDLGTDDIDLLLNSKYKIDESVNSDEEIRLARLQMKIDSNEARKKIEAVRSKYKAPISQASQNSGQFDDRWTQRANEELESLEAIDFAISKDKTFSFGLDPKYKESLSERNKNPEKFFESYKDSEGNFNFDDFNMHRAVVDNIGTIVRSVYQQGLSDGRLGVVADASNAGAPRPGAQGPTPQGPSSLTQQLEKALLGSTGMVFKV
jgi:hypothetical protein